MKVPVDHEIKPKDLKILLQILGIKSASTSSDGVSGDFLHLGVDLSEEIELSSIFL